jgi:hypothetical protein
MNSIERVFDKHELMQLLPLLHTAATYHRGHMLDSLINASETSALLDVRLRQYNAKISAVRRAIIALADLQLRTDEEAQMQSPAIQRAIDNLLQ